VAGSGDPNGTRDWLLHRIAWDLARIDQRLTAIEATLAKTVSPSEWLKAMIGLLLPLLVLVLTGNVEAARKLIGL
jgi:hypothetical protein